MTEENHMGWTLVKGVRRDVINLFKLFANRNSVRFEDFSEVWKGMNFSLIYSNRTTFIELLEFSEEVLLIVKEYLSSVYEFHIRVATLYTLYGLYFKQPIKGAAKIRFTKSDWEEVFSFIESCKAVKHYDVVYIFMKLYLSGAFSFTATPRTAGLERGYRKYFEKRTALASKLGDSELLYRPLVSQKLVESLVKLESLYCRKKSELLGSKNLVFIDGDFAKSLQEELRNYALSTQSKNSRDEEGSSNAGASSQECETSNANSRISRAKRKSTIENKSCEDVPTSKNRITKKYMDLLAKKKAEFYIRKLQGDSGATTESDKIMSLNELLDSSFSDSDEDK